MVVKTIKMKNFCLITLIGLIITLATPAHAQDFYFWTSYDSQGEVDDYVMTETIASSDTQYGFSVYIKSVMRNEGRIKYKNLAIFFWDDDKATWKVRFPDSQRGNVVEVNSVPYAKKIFEICQPIWHTHAQ